ncbi:PilZ domain-containing protein [Hoeflea marina]|uniref:PilZ domain-containing protein n=1 Tax=Hoeflea marina TaxID=274592 RepID=A0A317PRY6_9HYPH|nr:PilZ domain-containing protein [Hoeflea marina]PWW04241.1 PilZ domain-containing protein [Hoeflea marina]
MGFISRRSNRVRTRIRATIECNGVKTRGSVLDLSEDGMCVYISDSVRAHVGHEINVLTEEMGMLSGIAQWTIFPRIGVRLNLSSNSRAKIESFYKNCAATHIRG